MLNKNAMSVLLTVTTSLLTLVFLYVAYSGFIDTDETEHVHVSYLLSEGIFPYRDTHQIHTPLLWIITAPLFSIVPKSVHAFLFFRILCLASLAFSCVLGYFIIRELSASDKRIQLLLMLSVVLGYAGSFQLHFFRPDPFMAMFTTWAILLILRIDRRPGIYTLLSGICFGLAASFSPKMAPLCFLLPLAYVFKCSDKGSLKGWQLLALHPLGFVIGLCPVLIWLIYHDLFPHFYSWVLLENVSMVQQNVGSIYSTLHHRFAELSVGAAAFLCFQSRGTTGHKNVLLLSLAVLLGLLIPIVEPNHIEYNFQAMLIPGAIVIAISAFKLSSVLKPIVWLPCFTIVLALLLRQPFLYMASDGVSYVRIEKHVLDRLISLPQNEDTECLAILPYHPIFCRNATELYLPWDLLLVARNKSLNTAYGKMWHDAIKTAKKHHPDLILDPHRYWHRARRANIISAGQLREFEAFKTSFYRKRQIDGYSVWLKPEYL